MNNNLTNEDIKSEIRRQMDLKNKNLEQLKSFFGNYSQQDEVLNAAKARFTKTVEELDNLQRAWEKFHSNKEDKFDEIIKAK